MGLGVLEGTKPSELHGFEVGWRDNEGEHRLPLTDAVWVPFETGRPVRGFPSYRGQRHFPGLYWSSTTGGHVGFESWLERDHAMLLDFTPQVTGLLSQPLWLFWEDERGKRISHAPDYFARFEDGGWWWTAGLSTGSTHALPPSSRRRGQRVRRWAGATGSSVK